MTAEVWPGLGRHARRFRAELRADGVLVDAPGRPRPVPGRARTLGGDPGHRVQLLVGRRRAGVRLRRLRPGVLAHRRRPPALRLPLHRMASPAQGVAGARLERLGSQPGTATVAEGRIRVAVGRAPATDWRNPTRPRAPCAASSRRATRERPRTTRSSGSLAAELPVHDRAWLEELRELLLDEKQFHPSYTYEDSSRGSGPWPIPRRGRWRSGWRRALHAAACLPRHRRHRPVGRRHRQTGQRGGAATTTALDDVRRICLSPFRHPLDRLPALHGHDLYDDPFEPYPHQQIAAKTWDTEQLTATAGRQGGRVLDIGCGRGEWHSPGNGGPGLLTWPAGPYSRPPRAFRNTSFIREALRDNDCLLPSPVMDMRTCTRPASRRIPSNSPHARGCT